jgi:thioredoxin reductase (NADPH)
MLQGCNLSILAGQQGPPIASLPVRETMPQSRHSLIETRRDQMFPVLEPAEIGRLWRFGELKSYAAGDRIVATGKIAPGAFVILAGRVDVTRRANCRDTPSSL